MPRSFFIDPDGKILKTTTGITDKKDRQDGAKALVNLLQKESGRLDSPPGRSATTQSSAALS